MPRVRRPTRLARHSSAFSFGYARARRDGAPTPSRRTSPRPSRSSTPQATRRGSRWPGASSRGRPVRRAASATRPRPPGTRSSMLAWRETSARSGAPRRRTPPRRRSAPLLVDEAIDRCEAAMEQTAGDRQSEGHLLAVLAGLYAMQGEFEHARTQSARSRSIFEDLGLQMESARLGMDTGTIERLAGNLDVAASEFRSAYDALDALGETFARSTVAGFLAQTLLEQGALDEATAFCERSRELTTEADIATHALWRYVRGQDPRTPGSGGRGRGDLSRGDRASRADGRDRLPDRGAGRPRRGADRRDPTGRGACGVPARGEPRGNEGRRRDPHRRAPPNRGSRRRPDDERERLGHQFQGPFPGASATTVQILG